ncbi:DUF983 domain-containing protein [Aureimonas altamirensis]|uniref:DUF983 domain-containing protein n=1 Tax=Aureimonas altamirensis TaxID=370622 RepID=UPI002036D27E|nr:DUF983 domain-containing protein [Aureimonas altamirensis]MCM2503543.1 DUF983 domain-containing protein [Aureimonas altamirensis]
MTVRQETRLELDGKAGHRDLATALKRGFLCRCPNCGKGRLFKSFLRSVDACARCGETYHHHRADDLPPYLTIFIVGHVVVALFMGVEEVGDLPLWAHLAIWVPLTTVFTLALLQPIKGATIGLQWALRMHGFGGEDETTHH